MSTNFYLCYRPFHVFYVDKIKKEYYKDSYNVLISHNFFINNISFDEKIVVNGSIIKKVLTLNFLKNKILNTIETTDIVNIFVPHIAGILSNYAFYNFSKYENVNINFFYEGILYFYHYKHKGLKNFHFYFSRYISSIAALIKYRPTKEILPCYSKKVNYYFVPESKYSIVDNKKKKIVKIESEKIIVNAHTILLLGQKIKLTRKEHFILYNKIIDDIELIPNVKIYYKKHPFDKKDFFSKIAKERGIKFNLIRTNQAVEELLINIKPSLVISLVSSALINIRLMLPNEIITKSYIIKSSDKKGKRKELLDVFRNIGIIIHYEK